MAAVLKRWVPVTAQVLVVPSLLRGGFGAPQHAAAASTHLLPSGGGRDTAPSFLPTVRHLHHPNPPNFSKTNTFNMEKATEMTQKCSQISSGFLKGKRGIAFVMYQRLLILVPEP